jgi:hypothetical protein
MAMVKSTDTPAVNNSRNETVDFNVVLSDSETIKFRADAPFIHITGEQVEAILKGNIQGMDTSFKATKAVVRKGSEYVNFSVYLGDNKVGFLNFYENDLTDASEEDHRVAWIEQLQEDLKNMIEVRKVMTVMDGDDFLAQLKVA